MYRRDGGNVVRRSYCGALFTFRSAAWSIAARAGWKASPSPSRAQAVRLPTIAPVQCCDGWRQYKNEGNASTSTAPFYGPGGLAQRRLTRAKAKRPWGARKGRSWKPPALLSMASGFPRRHARVGITSNPCPTWVCRRRRDVTSKVHETGPCVGRHLLDRALASSAWVSFGVGASCGCGLWPRPRT
jgi:hypothetical protein